PYRTKHRIAAHTIHKLFLPADHACLRPAQKLVSAEHHQRDARVDALLYRGFAHAEFGKIDETPRAEIFHERQSASLAEGNEFFNRRLIGKTGDLEVRRMHAKQYARLLVDSAFVVRDVRAVRSADFAKVRATLLHDFRYSKSIANFDQFSARDDHFAAARQRRKRH